ncbi:cation efflux family-domain-containing protein [Zopfochytrium polystomum]|nr:cation efflux family-domain-containing protein [Zopfochytrium polystomum]
MSAGKSPVSAVAGSIDTLGGLETAVGSSRPSSLDDPLRLRTAKKSDEELRILSNSKKNRNLVRFYERQNEFIDELLSPVDSVVDEEEEARGLVKLQIALYGSLGANIMLLVLQLVAALTSGSLSLFATMADAFMDLASSLVLVFTGAASKKKNLHKYPTGKRRFETAGIIVFSCLMGALSLELIIEGARSLAGGSSSVDLSPISLSCIGAAIVVKAFLYFYCVALSNYRSAQILALDHRNDIVLNGVGIALSVMGQYIRWWIDPMGAIIIAAWILRSWSATAFEHIQMVIGKGADPAFLSRLTYIAMTHSPKILQVDTCRAYSSGAGYFVEVDVVLPPEMPLCEAHDVGEALQVKLEQIPTVERAFVHLDYETSHKPEHKTE